MDKVGFTKFTSRICWIVLIGNYSKVVQRFTAHPAVKDAGVKGNNVVDIAGGCQGDVSNVGNQIPTQVLGAPGAGRSIIYLSPFF